MHSELEGSDIYIKKKSCFYLKEENQSNYWEYLRKPRRYLVNTFVLIEF